MIRKKRDGKSRRSKHVETRQQLKRPKQEVEKVDAANMSKKDNN